ncbi:hypothetical protein F511_22904 [Dorcoceras hygrometricum]|uniref:Uncharacterized protein n=1 Tax=Dorcoceras hygrometricum TaxID=472368 RepID=A0A2Z7CEA1_9LAMI|nr:hypothetical protein F511_22904 [Dorcoceras hygrometricum]
MKKTMSRHERLRRIQQTKSAKEKSEVLCEPKCKTAERTTQALGRHWRLAPTRFTGNSGTSKVGDGRSPNQGDRNNSDHAINGDGVAAEGRRPDKKPAKEKDASTFTLQRSVALKWKEDKIAFWSAEEFWKLSNGKNFYRGYILEATPIEDVFWSCSSK